MTILRRKVTAFHVAIIGIMLLLGMITLQGIFFYKQSSKAEESRKWVAHTYEVLGAIRTPFAKIKDAQIAQRGYLLTGNESFLEPYYAAIGDERAGNSAKRMGYLDINSFAANISELRVLIKDNKEQLHSLERLEYLLHQQMNFITKCIETYRKNPADAIQMVRGGDGQKIMNELRIIVTEMMDRERKLLSERLIQDKHIENTFTWSIIILALFTYSGLLIAILIITRYFAHIRRVESELVEKDTYFLAAAEGGIDAFLIFKSVYNSKNEVTGIVLEYMNSVAEKMMNSSIEKLSNKKIEEVFSYRADSADKILQIYLDVLSAKKAHQSEYCITSGINEGRYYQEQVVPLPDGIAVSCRDITERKTMERLKNEFVSMVSHELRTPLTSIRAALGLVLGENPESLPGDSKELLTIAHNNCERLVRLINDILDIEKIESGKMVFDFHPVSLIPMIEQAIDNNRSFADKFNVTIGLEVAEDVTSNLHVIVDTDRLMQVLTNLISNAVKFSPKYGEVTLISSIKDGFAYVEVRDKGNGIPEEFHSRIFQKFAQADSSDTRQKGGTGLGLSIVKTIVEEMGGEIGFHSEIGEGTTFWFTMTIAAAQPKEISSSSNASNSGSRVLVCEDEEDVANLLKIILERAGFAVDIAKTATEANKLLNKNTYIAMTLDLMLPDKSGVTFIHELRAEASFFNLPIIVVSAKAEEGRKLLNGDAINVIDWMHKPIDVERLVQLVKGLGIAHRPNILHVEDDIDITRVLGLALNKTANLISAPTLYEARRLLESKVFDLVILDIGLPDGTGTDLLPLLGSEGTNPTPVILFTATEVSKELSEKVSASLIKSRTSEEKLLDTIRKLITPLT